MQQIPVAETLDVEAVERHLGFLWQQSANETPDETAVLRARVANLMVWTCDEAELDQIHETVGTLSKAHPCRALVVLADRDADDRDIELFVSSFEHDDNRGGKRLSCEELLMIARGKFVRELPSAALPLLVPDLPTFVWWRDLLELNDKTFLTFIAAADRLVIDTADAERPEETLLALAEFFKADDQQIGISDINWARLTSWRALMAGFYDVPNCRTVLSSVDTVTIDYSAPQPAADQVAPQALLLASWLATRLGWELADQSLARGAGGIEFSTVHGGGPIRVQLNRVDRRDIQPGRLSRAELTTRDAAGSFVVIRDENGFHLETHVTLDGTTQPGRVLPVRNRSAAQLLAREVEILCNDNIYAEAVAFAARIIQLYSKI